MLNSGCLATGRPSIPRTSQKNSAEEKNSYDMREASPPRASKPSIVVQDFDSGRRRRIYFRPNDTVHDLKERFKSDITSVSHPDNIRSGPGVRDDQTLRELNLFNSHTVLIIVRPVYIGRSMAV